MKTNDDNLLKNLMIEFNRYANYMASIKSFNDFLLSKQDIENGKREDWSAINEALKRMRKTDRGKYYLTYDCELTDPIRYPENIEEHKASIFQFGCYNSMPRNDRDDEMKISWDTHNNFLYNLYVYAMVHVIALNLRIIKGDNDWEIDEQYRTASKAIKYLLEKTTEKQIQSDKLSESYKPIECLMEVEYPEPEFLFGHWVEIIKRTPKVNATAKEMLEWIGVAKKLEMKQNQRNGRENLEPIAEEVQIKLSKIQEYKDELDKIYQEGCNEEKKLEKEEKEVPNKVYDYSVNFKFFLFVAIVSYVLAGIRIFGSRDSSSYIVYFIFFPSVFGVIYYFIKGFYYKRFYKQIITKKRHESYEKRERREEELRRAIELLEKMIFMNNRNETEEDVIKLYKFMKKNNPNTTEEIDKIMEEFTSYIKVADTKNGHASSNKNKFTQDEKYSLIIMEEYSRKEKLGVIMATLLLVGSVILGYTTIVYLIVALVASYGIYKAYKTNKQINANRVLFEENKSIKSRIEKYIKTVCNHNIDMPFYGFSKVSDKVVDEIYHFFKDRKTEIEISMRTVKDSDVPYDEMDEESLCCAVEKSKEYDKLEKNGFSELQKIKAYGSVLERI